MQIDSAVLCSRETISLISSHVSCKCLLGRFVVDDDDDLVHHSLSFSFSLSNYALWVLNIFFIGNSVHVRTENRENRKH